MTLTHYRILKDIIYFFSHGFGSVTSITVTELQVILQGGQDQGSAEGQHGGYGDSEGGVGEDCGRRDFCCLLS